MTHLSAEEIRQVIVGSWIGRKGLPSGATSEEYYTFYEDGSYDQDQSMGNTVYNDLGAGVVSGYSWSHDSKGTYRIGEAGELILTSDSGTEQRPPFELDKWGSEMKIWGTWFWKRS